MTVFRNLPLGLQLFTVGLHLRSVSQSFFSKNRNEYCRWGLVFLLGLFFFSLDWQSELMEPIWNQLECFGKTVFIWSLGALALWQSQDF
jgi:hypothetical protein